jgi:hypothetical protein
MRSQIRLWNVKDGQLKQLPQGSFSENHKEKDLETWVEQDPSLLGRELTIIGRQVFIPNAGPLDLLAVDEDGRLVVVEFKRDITTREAIAQILDYASSLRRMVPEQLALLSNIDATKIVEVTEFDPAMILVAADVDEKAERIVEYLASKAQLSIEVVTFTYVPLSSGEEILARSVLVPETPPATRQATNQVALPELLQVASRRTVEGLVELFRKVESLGWWPESLNRNGGTLRYWVITPDSKNKVLFGMNIGGEKLGSPEGSLDLWLNPDTVAEYSGISLDTTWDELEVFPVIKKSNTKIYIRVADEQIASKLYALFAKWKSTGEQATGV